MKQAPALAPAEFSPLDLHIGRLLARLAPDCPEVELAAALVSRAAGQGHVCLPLEVLCVEAQDIHPDYPSLEELRERLLASPVVSRTEATPLVLETADRLYLQRLHHDETMVARDLQKRASIHFSFPELQTVLNALFPDSSASDGQKTAAAMAATRGVVAISGGPGTGKTYTAARIIALVQALEPDLRIALAAPTGKAAARLQEAIIDAMETLPAAYRQPPPTAGTLHRLLGYHPARGFKHDAENPLDLNLLLIDEASMVDLPLMASLLQALPAACRLVLLGDRNQLASVEVGRLFADLCTPGSRGRASDNSAPRALSEDRVAAKDKKNALAVCLLSENHRFSADSGIGRLCEAINTNEIAQVNEILSQDWPDLIHHADPSDPGWLHERILTGYLPLSRQQDPAAALAGLDHFRIICGLTRGRLGVEGLNILTEHLLFSAGAISRRDQWYKGRPIMITANDYDLGLFNGDTGICWPDDTGMAMVWFQRGNGQVIPVRPAALPPHQTAYAITIHKAQGSEFGTTLMVLPEDDVPLLTRELLYTGISRARTLLLLHGDRELIHLGMSRQTRRFSGLGERLAGNCTRS
ncbi:MAG: exodeoxyribonuclease V subunit alpha [Desulfobulbus propionicus]|nr:MAG: exodeoxyribonuclease V subunit alpha [Desulfobulbus propionicus]